MTSTRIAMSPATAFIAVVVYSWQRCCRLRTLVVTSFVSALHLAGSQAYLCRSSCDP